MTSENLRDQYHSFLESLVGKEVKIYRGGPESKSGILLDVQADFVTVYAQNNNNNNNNNNDQNNAQNNGQNNNNNQNTVVYYNIRHIASISENSVNNSTLNLQQQLYQQEPEFVQAESFTGVVAQLEGKYVQINQGGPESKKGQVLGVVDDYIVLFTEDDGVVYFNVQHIKSIAEYNQNNQNQNQNGNYQMTQTIIPEYETVDSFHGIFSKMAHKWIAINRGGPEAMEGILVEHAGGHYTLINNQEVMRINPYHIKSISSGPKGALKQQNQNNQQNQQQNQNNQQNTEATAQQSNENKNKSEDKNKSESRKGSSRRNNSREKVVKTIDYVWKSN
ncbi:spore coat protein [Pseudoneobacillus sp. C159]